QTIAALGGSYQLTSVLQLRLGYSYASNPVPRAYINPLFPAVTRHHYAVGVGFDVMPSATVNFSVSYAAPATARNNRAMAGVSSSMRQRNWQLGYVFRY
ncbi:MAG: outer membrane protein transport protein, partial [Gammaproteobacteria bacterium]|nr:outer membrane protein transport protein [Gammaproteobacteria bacterium]